MDDHNDFDNVSWRNNDAESDNDSRPNTADASHHLPIRNSTGKRKMSADVPQSRDLTDPVDLGGIGDGVLECTVDSPLKENDGTKDAYMSYLVTTHVLFGTISFQGLDAANQAADRFQIFPETRYLRPPPLHRFCILKKRTVKRIRSLRRASITG